MDEKRFRQYLLGDLPNGARERLEEQLMVDEEWFEELLRAEGELVDDYVRGTLSSDEKEKFTNFFLSTPERHRELAFASTLRTYVSTAAAPESSESNGREAEASSFGQWLRGSVSGPAVGWKLALTAALLLLVFGGVVTMVQMGRLQSQVDRIVGAHTALQGQERELRAQLDRSEERNINLAEELSQERSQLTSLREQLNVARLVPPSIPTFRLTPGLLRGSGSTHRVSIPRNTPLVNLDLDTGSAGYQRYRAVLHEVEGGEIWALNSLRVDSVASGEVVSLSVPANLLPQDDYYITLDGIVPEGTTESVGRYDFRVLTP